MRTSFHHQPEAQHPNFQLSTSWQADYPIFRGGGHASGNSKNAAPPRSGAMIRLNEATTSWVIRNRGPRGPADAIQPDRPKVT